VDADTRVSAVSEIPGGRRFVGVVLLDPRGWILLQERDEHPAIDPDTWGLVGGHVDPGEEQDAAAYRELAEETEIALPPGRLTPWKTFDVDHIEAYGSIDRMAVYIAAVELTDADVVCHEGRRIVFVEPGSVAGLPLSKAAAAILPELLCSGLYGRLTP
jgi:8-oxo-dGTP diphosphatase